MCLLLSRQTFPFLLIAASSIKRSSLFFILNLTTTRLPLSQNALHAIQRDDVISSWLKEFTTEHEGCSFA